MASSGVDAAFVAFGERSLATLESRHQFAAVLSCVRSECVACSVPLNELASVEAAWQVFSELSDASSALASDEELKQKARAAISAVLLRDHKPNSFVVDE
jgi:hypothetical protein